MKVLPNPDKSKRALQKVIVADKSGVITCFGIKKKEVMVPCTLAQHIPYVYISMLTVLSVVYYNFIQCL